MTTRLIQRLPWLLGGLVGLLACWYWGMPRPAYASSCNEALWPGNGWSRTTIWVQWWAWTAQELGTGQLQAEVHETNRGGPPCTGNDGVTWWGTWRGAPRGVARSAAKQDPSGNPNRVDRDTWPGSIETASRVSIAIPQPPQGLYAAGEWYPSYDPQGAGYEDVFRHDDVFIWNAPPPPTPTPVPTATPTPRPGTITVSVMACGVPFGTRITRVDTGEGYDGVSWQSFVVPAGVPITFQASGYGDYLDTTGTATTPFSLVIDIRRRPEAGPCPNQVTPTAGPTSTPPPAPSCQIVHPDILQALDLLTTTGSRANPVPVLPGPLALHWTTKGIPYGDATTLTSLSVVDVTNGSNHLISKSDWNRPFTDETPASLFFAAGNQVNVSDVQTSRNNTAWQWNSGWITLNTAPLLVGHTYEINSLFVQAKSCNNVMRSGYVTVPAPDIRISVRQAALSGQDTGPIAQRPIQANGTVVGQTNAQGRFIYRRQPTDTAATVALQVVTPATAVTWTVTGSCLEQDGVSVDLDAHTVSGIATGDCDLVWTQIQRPVITANAFFRNGPGDYSPAHFGTMVLITDDGTPIVRVTVNQDVATTLAIPAATLRTLVGSTSWSLSYFPTTVTPPWQQTAPRAGSGGDLVADDLALTFRPGDSRDNRFFIERDGAQPSSLLTIRGSVALINRDGSVTSGAYGTVTAAWTVYQHVKVPVAPDGTFTIVITNLAYSPTVRLSFQKSLATASYDHAVAGTVDGQPQGTVVAPTQIDGITISNTGSGSGYQFVLRELPPPPPPPIASGDVRLWMHSHLDPQQGVYRSDTTTVAWPLAEILDAAPAVTLAPLPPAVPGYRYDQRVVAWSYDGSGTEDAQAAGCRPGAAPGADAGDTSLLPGCVYRYIDGPSASDMGRQARLFWGVYVPDTLPDTVYRYALPTLQRVDLRLSVLVETAVVDTTTGQRWTQRQVLGGSFVVRLAAPRTAK